MTAFWHYRVYCFGQFRRPYAVTLTSGIEFGATENARPENAGLENDGQNFSQLWAKLRGLENAGLENGGPC